MALFLFQNKLKYCSAVEYKHLCQKKNYFLGTDHAKYGINRQTLVPNIRTGFQHVMFGTNVGGFHLRSLM